MSIESEGTRGHSASNCLRLSTFNSAQPELLFIQLSGRGGQVEERREAVILKEEC